MAEARSRGPRAWPLADRPRPGASSNRHAAGALVAWAAVCVVVIAAVMASRDVTA
jgi:hypothetical protein